MGKVRVVICYGNENLKGEPVFLAANRLYSEEKVVVLCCSLRFCINKFYKNARAHGSEILIAVVYLWFITVLNVGSSFSQKEHNPK